MVVKCGLVIIRSNLHYSSADVARVAAQRLDDPVNLDNAVFNLRRVGRNHNRNEELVVALFLEVAQIECVIVNLVICSGAIFAVAALELEQKNDVAIQHNVVDALAHSRDAILKEDFAFIERSELVLENRNLLLPSVALLNPRCRLSE